MLKLKKKLGFAIGCGNFHIHVYGLPPFRTETDHQKTMSPGIQGIVLTMQCYDATLFTRGKYIVRPPDPNMLVSPVTDNAEIHKHGDCFPPTADDMLQQIVQETVNDPLIQIVLQRIIQDRVCPMLPKMDGHLCMYNGLLMRQNRPAIPQSMHQDIMHHIQGGHLAMEKCKKISSVLTRYK